MHESIFPEKNTYVNRSISYVHVQKYVPHINYKFLISVVTVLKHSAPIAYMVSTP